MVGRRRSPLKCFSPAGGIDGVISRIVDRGEFLEIDKQMNTRGYFPAHQARPADCIFCAICGTICPDVAITINEIAGQAAGAAKRRK